VDYEELDRLRSALKVSQAAHIDMCNHNTELEDAISEAVGALDDIAQWHDGKKITAWFDCPAHAHVARKLLAKLKPMIGEK